MDVLELIVSWPGVFLILGLLIFIAFMIHPKFFENFKFIFKRKDKEIQIESKSVEHKAAEEKVGTEPSASLQKKKIKTEEIEEGAQEIMDKALDAYEKKDIEEFTKFWDIAIEKLDEPLKSNFLALRFFHRYHLGDKDAIEELNKLIDEENKSSKFAREYLAKIYQRLDKTKDAIDLINKNIEASNDVKDTLKYSFKLCDLKIESKAYKETEEILKILRDKYHDSLSVSKIMKKFGELYEEMEKLEIALCYFEI